MLLLSYSQVNSRVRLQVRLWLFPSTLSPNFFKTTIQNFDAIQTSVTCSAFKWTPPPPPKLKFVFRFKRAGRFFVGSPVILVFICYVIFTWKTFFPCPNTCLPIRQPRRRNWATLVAVSDVTVWKNHHTFNDCSWRRFPFRCLLKANHHIVSPKWRAAGSNVCCCFLLTAPQRM